ncbi:hypothetical protein RF11_06178 [Thelohanellus kitauei]|uniref:Mos1 transposase HTH domain-containing protein n=1 Tax=Thelohanellus kitauei TaxID=669202 RepID=A0A0C2J3M2_THEKT|nr:hypothetical protein RF11_06178 [Thelohanellus kitauei]
MDTFIGANKKYMNEYIPVSTKKIPDVHIRRRKKIFTYTPKQEKIKDIGQGCFINKQKRRNETYACRNLLKVFVEGTASDITFRRWFEKFEAVDLGLSEKLRTGKPSSISEMLLRPC